MNNTKLLKDYATFLVKISKICQPVIVAGGGNIARHYISHARSSGADESTLDELGIEVSRLNAKLLIYALKNRAYPHPPTNLQEVKHAEILSGLIDFLTDLFIGLFSRVLSLAFFASVSVANYFFYSFLVINYGICKLRSCSFDKHTQRLDSHNYKNKYKYNHS